MTDLTLMTFASDPATVLPSLALLSHRVRVLPMDAASLVKMPESTILFLDARDDLATAKTLCRLIHASGLSTPIVLILTEGGFTVVNSQWGIADVVVASTGVIGQPLDVTPIANKIDELVQGLGDHSDLAAEGIMTTDTVKKDLAVSFTVGGVECKLGGIAKGSGMIHPNMATMLVFLTTDCAISSAMLQKALSSDIKNTFNMVSVDGDTSTNDMVAVLANGMAGNQEITAEGPDFDAFMKALNTVTVHLCRSIAGDGEGATKLLECVVTGAAEESVAKTVAKSVICSSLTKAAMFGADANWGRVLCAIGYSGAPVDIHKVDVAFKSPAGTVEVCKNGAGIEFSEEEAKKVLLEKEITIQVELNSGTAGAVAWGCDLTYEYVKINGDYRT